MLPVKKRNGGRMVLLAAMIAVIVLALCGVLLPLPLTIPLLLAGSWGVAEWLSAWRLQH
jgi:uncharacterized protein (DUF2062 family)